MEDPGRGTRRALQGVVLKPVVAEIRCAGAQRGIGTGILHSTAYANDSDAALTPSFQDQAIGRSLQNQAYEARGSLNAGRFSRLSPVVNPISFDFR